MEPGNEKIALMIIENLCDPTKAVPASAIGVPNFEKEGVEAVAITYRRKMPDGSTVPYYCANSVKGFEIYNEFDKKANAKPRFNLGEEQVAVLGGKLAGHNKLLCVAVGDLSPSDKSNDFKTDDRPGSAMTPTRSPHNLFTWWDLFSFLQSNKLVCVQSVAESKEHKQSLATLVFFAFSK